MESETRADPLVVHAWKIQYTEDGLNMGFTQGRTIARWLASLADAPKRSGDAVLHFGMVSRPPLVPDADDGNLAYERDWYDDDGESSVDNAELEHRRSLRRGRNQTSTAGRNAGGWRVPLGTICLVTTGKP